MRQSFDLKKNVTATDCSQRTPFCKKGIVKSQKQNYEESA